MISKILSTPWHTMRWLRLAMGLYLVFVSYGQKELAIGLFGILFLFQALFDLGCCGPQGCSIPVKKKEGSDKILDSQEHKSR